MIAMGSYLGHRQYDRVMEREWWLAADFRPFSVEAAQIVRLGVKNFATFVSRLLADEVAAQGMVGSTCMSGDQGVKSSSPVSPTRKVAETHGFRDVSFLRFDPVISNPSL